MSRFWGIVYIAGMLAAFGTVAMLFIHILFEVFIR